MKDTKTKALKGKLINNIGYCDDCEMKHAKGKHKKEKDDE